MAYTAEDTELFKHLQLTLVSKNQKIAELQTQPLRLYDYCWSTEDAPNDMLRSADAVIGDDHVIYLRQGKSQPSVIHRYSVLEHKWLDPVPCNDVVYDRFSMAYHQQVILIGGAKLNESQCGTEIFVSIDPLKILSYMQKERCRTTTLKCFHGGQVFLIVIGGEDSQEKFLTTVEILNLTDPNDRRIAQDIPEALSCSSGAIVGRYIYLLGGWIERNVATPSVYRCSVDALIATTAPNHTLGDVWEKLPDLPVEEAACTSFKDQVMVVGGQANKAAVHDIRTYNEVQRRWDVIGYLPHSRYNCFAIGLADELIAIGGGKHADSNDSENTIDVYQGK